MTIDDALVADLKEVALRERTSLKQVVNRMLRLGLQASRTATTPTPYRCPTFSMGTPLVPTLDRSLTLAASLENDEIARKLAARK